MSNTRGRGFQNRSSPPIFCTETNKNAIQVHKNCSSCLSSAVGPARAGTTWGTSPLASRVFGHPSYQYRKGGCRFHGISGWYHPLGGCGGYVRDPPQDNFQQER